MAYVHYVSKERLQPVDIYCEAFLNGDEAKEIEKLVHEVYARLDRRFHMQSENWKINYHEFRDIGDKGCLGSCIADRRTGITESIEIYPDALCSSKVFFEVIRHEYAHAVAELRWSGDEYYDSHSKHGRIWQQIAREVGCKAKSSIETGEYFTHVLKDKSGNIIYFATGIDDAQCVMESEDPNLGIHIVDGEEIYQEYLGKKDEKKKAKENENLILQAAKDKLLENLSLKAAKYEAELELINVSTKSIEKEIREKSGLRIFHMAFGEGYVKKSENGRLEVSFDSGKTTTFGLKKVIELGLISFIDFPDLSARLDNLKPLFAHEKDIRESYEHAIHEREKAEVREIWTFGEQKSVKHNFLSC